MRRNLQSSRVLQTNADSSKAYQESRRSLSGGGGGGPAPKPSNVEAGSCGTMMETAPWIEMKFDDIYNVFGAVMQNMSKCCKYRFRNYNITVDGQHCGSGDAKGKGGFSTTPCDRQGGAYTRVGKLITITGAVRMNQLMLRYFGAVGHKTYEYKGYRDGLGWGLQGMHQQDPMQNWDCSCFKKRYVTLSKSKGNNCTTLESWFLKTGMGAGYAAGCLFNCDCYRARYKDIDAHAKKISTADFNLHGRKGGECQRAKAHMTDHGIREKRNAKCDFDCGCYIRRYKDVKNAVGNDCQKAFKSWTGAWKYKGNMGGDLRKGRNAKCSSPTAPVPKVATSGSKKCTTKASTQTMDSTFATQGAMSGMTQQEKGILHVYEAGVSDSNKNNVCPRYPMADPKYAWNNMSANENGKNACTYSSCMLGTATYFMGANVRDKESTSSGCSYYGVDQYPFDPMSCHPLYESKNATASCPKDHWGVGGWQHHRCRCMTDSACPKGKTKTACSNVAPWNKRDKQVGRKRNLQLVMKSWLSAGKALNGQCCLYNAITFNCTCYRNRYGDLKKAFGSNCAKLEDHYEKHGYREGRNPMCQTNPFKGKLNMTQPPKCPGGYTGGHALSACVPPPPRRRRRRRRDDRQRRNLAHRRTETICTTRYRKYVNGSYHFGQICCLNQHCWTISRNDRSRRRALLTQQE